MLFLSRPITFLIELRSIGERKMFVFASHGDKVIVKISPNIKRCDGHTTNGSNTIQSMPSTSNSERKRSLRSSINTKCVRYGSFPLTVRNFNAHFIDCEHLIGTWSIQTLQQNLRRAPAVNVIKCNR